MFDDDVYFCPSCRHLTLTSTSKGDVHIYKCNLCNYVFHSSAKKIFTYNII
ncbi:MAG: hypothetical protein MRT15_08930 [archaeon YNP-LCB-003-016]|uniref:zf-TFIIB domain-containing protein n=1 Tax=Candidatus Culexarchaeum yellowstonense TaxID=2928963 RepID=UPI0026F05866|nr:zf-TFIIB domain-containing protein [Candidatus Culexarchaeum yellowstonense]MCR6692502.1 hypothetical protein [Candidatus Culexarchaeum yellowstonense]